MTNPVHPLVARAELLAQHRVISAVRIERIKDADLPRRWSLYEEGQGYGEFVGTKAEAKREARDNCDAGNYGSPEKTVWIDWEIRCELTGEDEAGTVECDPDEPACAEGHEHAWETPYSVLGGLKENPGVWGHGGGVIMKFVCRHCGKYRVVDTWAQRMDTGEQGLNSIRYEDADEESSAWVDSLN